MIVAGHIVAGALVAGAILAGDVVGGGGGDVDTTSVTVAGASWDVSDAAIRRGSGGCNRNGSYILTDAGYVWCSHDDGTGRFAGYDPGDFVAELSGLDGTEVQLGEGVQDASSVAAAIRAATGWGGSGAVVQVPGFVGLGASWDERGTAGMFGNRNQVHASIGGPMNEALATHGTTSASDELITGFSFYLVNADVGEEVALALYVGGSSGSFAGTTLAASRVVTSSGTGQVCISLTADEVFVANSTSVWLVGKGITSNTRWGFADNGVFDFTNQPVQQIDLDPDPATPFPASLAAANVTASYSIRQMCALEFRTSPYVGDASWQATLGVHSDDVLSSPLQSDLTGVDPNGANVQMPVMSPDVPGMTHVELGVAVGSEHSSQFRMGLRSGGVVGDPTGSARVVDGGLTTGSATDAWASATGGAGTAIEPGVVHWIGIRSSTGTVSVRYAAAESGLVDPPGFPSDYLGGAAAEYESNTANPSYSTDQTVPIEATFTADDDDVQPANYPGFRWIIRVAGDTAA